MSSRHWRSAFTSLWRNPHLQNITPNHSSGRMRIELWSFSFMDNSRSKEYIYHTHKHKILKNQLHIYIHAYFFSSWTTADPRRISHTQTQNSEKPATYLHTRLLLFFMDDSRSKEAREMVILLHCLSLRGGLQNKHCVCVCGFV